ncbi:MAG: 50S ribosomal protein L24 [Oceanipulchritudo sp.]|jgi:large subunit ribosomal protein L24
MNRRIKSGDEVVVIAGNHRGDRGKVMQVFPREDRVIVEGVNKRKHHEKKTQDNPEGAIVERENPIHLSNVMLASRYSGKVAAKNK